MSYAAFLLIFLVPPIVVGGWYFIQNDESESKKTVAYSILTLVILAVSYTTPWDNYLVKTKVWWYGPDRVIGTIGYVPIEEYSFFILQTIMTGLWYFFLHNKIGLSSQAHPNRYIKHFISVFYVALIALGILWFNQEESRYLSLILVWAMPVVLLQWVVGGQYLLTNLKLFMFAIFVPSMYLWVADSIAIADGIWLISPEQTLGFAVGPLPIEEAVFFLLTNWMVIQGMILFNIMGKRILSYVY
jgi:lycopene cyclase domain-containing protein